MKIKKYLFFLLILFCISSVSFAQKQNEWQSKVDAVVLNKLKFQTNTEFIVVMKEQADLSGAYKIRIKEEKGIYVYKKLTETANRTQPDIVNILNNKKASFQQFWVANVIWVNGDIDLIREISQLSSVDKIIENATYTFPKPVEELASVAEPDALEWNISKVKADQVWALGITGQGVVIAGGDTGYEWTHPALQAKYRGWNGTTADHNYNWHDAIHTGNGGICGLNSMAPCDDYSHGTHTMGIMVGDDGNGNQIGMAPGAKWIGCRNMEQGTGSLTSYIECFQFFLAPTNLADSSADPAKAPHVINNSWGCFPSEGCDSSNYATMETVINNLKAAGIVVVASAGNSGPNCLTITDPVAIYDNSFVVGSTMNTDSISSFSSRGPVTDYPSAMVKPDISAPGSNIRSCVPDSAYAVKSGTSMAGPHVAGLVALIISANPSLAGQVDSIESIIKNTAVHLTSSQSCGSISGSSIPNYTFGYGRIDALAAVNSALTSINEISIPEVSVKTYPNPFSQKVIFELTNWKTSTRFQLVSITGQVLISETWEYPKTKYEFDLSNLANGIYFYKLESKSNNIEGRISKVY